jgi:crotonobetainyl-CoA:carnitine CoA-transferase CaiB-like acyl-CoA transferase
MHPSPQRGNRFKPGQMPTPESSLPYAGVRVVEFTHMVMGPTCGMILADLGAEVIKVEPPKGDPFRRFGRPSRPMAAIFVNANRGKKSVVLDLKLPADRDRLSTLLDSADVMLSNWRPGVADRLGLGDDALAARNPRLIRVYVTGYGPSGPDRDKPSYDSVVQARSGLTWAQGDDDAPRLATGYLVDKMTASMAAQAVMAALYRRSVTGDGDAIDVPMLDVMAYLNFPELFATRTFVDDEPRDARNRQMMANRPMRASDGWILLSPVSGEQIRNAMVAVGHPEWADVVLSEKDGARMTELLVEYIESQTVAWPVAECITRFEANDVPVAQCLDLDAHLADPQIAHNEIYDIVDHPQLGRVRQVRYPARSKGWGTLRGRGIAPMADADHDALFGP